MPSTHFALWFFESRSFKTKRNSLFPWNLKKQSWLELSYYYYYYYYWSTRWRKRAWINCSTYCRRRWDWSNTNFHDLYSTCCARVKSNITRPWYKSKREMMSKEDLILRSNETQYWKLVSKNQDQESSLKSHRMLSKHNKWCWCNQFIYCL